MAEEIYYCQSCGGVMEFDVKTQALKCPNCDTVVEIDGNKEDVVEHTLNLNALRKVKVEEKQTITMVCSGCGAPIEVDKNSTALSCPYCGSSYVMADKQQETIVPDGIVTFKLTEQDVKDVFRNWMKKRYLAPNELKNLYQQGKFQGMYVPYWTFDADSVANYRAMGGRHRTVHYKDSEGNTRTKTVTDWYPTSGVVRKFFDDVLVCAAQRDDKYLLSGIDTYNTKNMPSYSPDYMSGYSAETYSVDLQSGHDKALRIMSNELRNLASKDVLRRYDTVRDVRINARFDKETYKYALVPVYSTSYTYKGKNYTVLVNGENGQIKGEYPKSIAKIMIIIAVVVAVVFGILFASNKNDDRRYNSNYGYENVAEQQILCYNGDGYVFTDNQEINDMPEYIVADIKED